MRNISDSPFVSIVIPSRNEEEFIGKCLDSIANQSYPKEKIEVLVIDGMSEDRTKAIIEDYVQRYSFFKLFNNPKKIIPTGMNIGIRNSSGDIVMKFDAHTAYENDYISKCVNFLIEYDADNIGGLQIPVPRKDTLIGKAIAISLSHPFGVGNSHHRLLSSKEPMWADTAYSGCYRRDVFERIGLYDENIARSEDACINSRLREAGGKTLLVPEIKSYYYARSKVGDFIKHNFDNGFWITYPLLYGSVLFSWRHLAPLYFIVSLLASGILGFRATLFLWVFVGSLGLYALASLASSFQIACQRREIRYLVVMPFIFGMLHIGYGLGSLWGVFKIVGAPQFWRKLLNRCV